MKAIVKKSGGTSLENIAAPKVAGDDDVLIRVSLAGLCRTDIYVAEGRVKSKIPVVLGHEFSGVVEAVGERVSSAKPGDRVAVMPLFPSTKKTLPNGLPSYFASTMLGVDHDGAFGELVVVPGASVHAIPDDMSFRAAAYMEPVAAAMAVLSADIHPHQRGVVYGDNRISRLAERVLRAKGFEDVEVCPAERDVADNSCDFVVETLATTETFHRMVRMLKPGGLIVLKSRQHTPVSINVNALVMKDIRLQAVSYGRFADAIAFVASGALKIDDLLGDVHPLEQWQDVFAASQKSETRKTFFAPNGKV